MKRDEGEEVAPPTSDLRSTNVQLRPSWDQDLQLSVRLPSTNMIETQRWAAAQSLAFTLYDCNPGGVCRSGSRQESERILP